MQWPTNSFQTSISKVYAAYVSSMFYEFILLRHAQGTPYLIAKQDDLCILPGKSSLEKFTESLKAVDLPT